MGFLNIDEHDLDPPFNRLTSEQPLIPVKNVDVTRRPLGFGQRAMPKLKRELHHKNIETVIAAIESICDLVHDPERGYEAVNLKIIDRMVNLLTHENPSVRERTCRTLEVLARLADGKEAIVKNKLILENLAICAEDEYPEVRIQVAALLEMTARFWKAADELRISGFIQILLANLVQEKREIVVLHLQTLKSLMYGLPGIMIATELEGFKIFIQLLDEEDPEIISGALACLSSLTSTCVGQKIAREENLLQIANKFLQDERPEIHTNAASVIMYCTIKTKEKITASNMTLLTKRLVQLSRNSLNRSTQIYAIKALTNVCEHPKIREQIRKKYMVDVNNIQVAEDPYVKEYKDILLTVIGWDASSST